MRRASVLLAVVLLAACGGDDGDATPATTAPTGPRPVGELTEARVDIIGGPDYLAEAAGSVWVKVDDGTLHRIDPETNEDVASVEVGSELCQGLGTDGEVLWTCGDGQSIVRVDPATEQVDLTVDVDKFPDQGSLPVAFGRVWVLTGSGDVLAGVRDGEVVTEIALEALCRQVTASADALWVSCGGSDSVLRVDPDAGEVVTTIPDVVGAGAIEAGEAVWVVVDEGVARIDPGSGTVDGVADLAGAESLLVGADVVWARTPGRFLRAIDPGSLEVVAEVEAPEQSGGSVLEAFGSVWTTAYDDAVLYRLRTG